MLTPQQAVYLALLVNLDIYMNIREAAPLLDIQRKQEVLRILRKIANEEEESISQEFKKFLSQFQTQGE